MHPSLTVPNQWRVIWAKSLLITCLTSCLKNVFGGLRSFRARFLQVFMCSPGFCCHLDVSWEDFLVLSAFGWTSKIPCFFSALCSRASNFFHFIMLRIYLLQKIQISWILKNVCNDLTLQSQSRRNISVLPSIDHIMQRSETGSNFWAL